MAELDNRIVTDKEQARDAQAWIDLPVFSAEDAALRDKALAELTAHERIALRHRERWLHRRRATDQLKVR
jgi:hypothetical protein